VRLVIARCSVDYSGRLNAHLPLATRVLMHKGDGSLLIHSDGGSYKPLNWMSPPCRLESVEPDEELAAAGVIEVWQVTHQKSGDALTVRIHEVLSDTAHDLGVDPGLIKDGVESDLQRLLAEQVELISEGATLVRREYPTAIGPVDLMVRDVAVTTSAAAEPGAQYVAVEIKRRAGIDAVEQLTRYLELLNRDPQLRPVRGILAAQGIAPQARTLAEDRGIECLVLDYEAMKGTESGVPTLF
jgi:RecB family endonuclease NucS